MKRKVILCAAILVLVLSAAIGLAACNQPIDWFSPEMSLDELVEVVAGMSESERGGNWTESYSMRVEASDGSVVESREVVTRVDHKNRIAVSVTTENGVEMRREYAFGDEGIDYVIRTGGGDLVSGEKALRADDILFEKRALSALADATDGDFSGYRSYSGSYLTLPVIGDTEIQFDIFRLVSERYNKVVASDYPDAEGYETYVRLTEDGIVAGYDWEVRDKDGNVTHRGNAEWSISDVGSTEATIPDEVLDMERDCIWK